MVRAGNAPESQSTHSHRSQRTVPDCNGVYVRAAGVYTNIARPRRHGSGRRVDDGYIFWVPYFGVHGHPTNLPLRYAQGAARSLSTSINQSSMPGARGPAAACRLVPLVASHGLSFACAVDGLTIPPVLAFTVTLAQRLAGCSIGQESVGVQCCPC